MQERLTGNQILGIVTDMIHSPIWSEAERTHLDQARLALSQVFPTPEPPSADFYEVHNYLSTQNVASMMIQDLIYLADLLPGEQKQYALQAGIELEAVFFPFAATAHELPLKDRHFVGSLFEAIVLNMANFEEPASEVGRIFGELMAWRDRIDIDSEFNLIANSVKNGSDSLSALDYQDDDEDDNTMEPNDTSVPGSLTAGAAIIPLSEKRPQTITELPQDEGQEDGKDEDNDEDGEDDIGWTPTFDGVPSLRLVKSDPLSASASASAPISPALAPNTVALSAPDAPIEDARSVLGSEGVSGEGNMKDDAEAPNEVSGEQGRTAMVKVVMEKAKETKNTWRFEEKASDGEALIGTLYVPKATLAQIDDPDVIEVTISAHSE